MKHVVMKAEKNYAVVLSDGGEFIKIRNKNYTVGQKITLPRYNYLSTIALAASFIIVFLSVLSGYTIYSTPEGYVSVDINPSIQFATNRFNKIIAVQSFNEDGKILLEQDNLKHKFVEDGIERIIELSISLGYLSEYNNSVVIGVVANSDDTLGTLQNKTEKYKDESIVIEIEQADEEILELSKELGASIGRAKALYEYTGSNGGDINENSKKLENESVAEIKNNYKAKRQQPDDTTAPSKTDNNKPEKADNNDKIRNKPQGSSNSENAQNNNSNKPRKDNSSNKLQNNRNNDKSEKIKENNKSENSGSKNKYNNNGNKAKKRSRRKSEKSSKNKNKAKQ